VGTNHGLPRSGLTENSVCGGNTRGMWRSSRTGVASVTTKRCA